MGVCVLGVGKSEAAKGKGGEEGGGDCDQLWEGVLGREEGGWDGRVMAR